MPSWHIKSKSLLIQLFLPCGNPSCLFILQLSIRLTIHSLNGLNILAKKALLLCSLNMFSTHSSVMLWLWYSILGVCCRWLKTVERTKIQSQLDFKMRFLIAVIDFFFLTVCQILNFCWKRYDATFFYYFEMPQEVMTSCSKAKEKQVTFCL